MARSRPLMVLGPPDVRHLWPIRAALELVWRHKIMRQPHSVTLQLSPRQYRLSVECGPIIRPLQHCLTWNGKYALMENWDHEVIGYLKHSTGRSEDYRLTGWRYGFTGPTGPKFYGMHAPIPFSHSFHFGIRGKEGFWRQSFRQGFPLQPATVEEANATGLFVAAHLEEEWYPTPFVPQDAESLQFGVKDSSYLRGNKRTGELNYIKWKSKRFWSSTTIEWRSKDDLIPSLEDNPEVGRANLHYE